MKQLLDMLGRPFVYRSPEPNQGHERFYREYLMSLTHKQLRPLAGTNSHLPKSVLVSRIISGMK